MAETSWQARASALQWIEAERTHRQGGGAPRMVALSTDELDAIAEGLRDRTSVERQCPACSVEARGLGAAAHNAWGAVTRVAIGEGSWSRAHRKLAQLRLALDAWQVVLNGHFADESHWKKVGAPDQLPVSAEGASSREHGHV